MPHETPDHYHLEIKEVQRETYKAFLCIITRIGDEELEDWDIWIPKSVITNPEDYKEGDKNATMLVQGWWIEKEEHFMDLFNL